MTVETDWRSSALCSQTDPELFWPDQGVSAEPAIKICMACDVRPECLEFALVEGIQDGVYGGMSSRARTKIRGKRLRGEAA